MSFDTALLTMADEIDELKAKVAKLEAEATAREPKLTGPLSALEMVWLDHSKGIDQTVITERPI